jgi:hypothetical protein
VQRFGTTPCGVVYLELAQRQELSRMTVDGELVRVAQTANVPLGVLDPQRQ